MYFSDYHDRIGYEQEIDNFIEKKMIQQRKEGLKSICRLVDQDLAEDFGNILSVALENGSTHAKKIAAMFGFNQSDFLALCENFEQYKKNYEQENSDWSDFYE